MLTILWIMTAAMVLAMAAALAARHGVAEGSAGVWLERARWAALGCERRVLAAIDAVLGDAAPAADVAMLWRTLPRRLERTSFAGCDVRFEAAGMRLDVNTATPEMLLNLLEALGLGSESAQLVDALEDWIDSDDEPRPFGAERAWYEAAGRFPPRNDSVADSRELARVRGFERLPGVDTLLSTAPGRVSLATASVAVLMAVPGVTRETAEQIVALQQAGTPPSDLLDVSRLVSQTSAAALEVRYADALRASTPDPDAWLVRVQSAYGTPAAVVRIEWRVVRAGRRAVVTATSSRI
jgi:type II secretory pathway component PulK